MEGHIPVVRDMYCKEPICKQESSHMRSSILNQHEPDHRGQIFPRIREDHLSDRELQVLDLVGRGLTADEIGSQLFISTSTVVSHRKNMQRKMRARNSTHLVFLACKMGLL